MCSRSTGPASGGTGTTGTPASECRPPLRPRWRTSAWRRRPLRASPASPVPTQFAAGGEMRPARPLRRPHASAVRRRANHRARAAASRRQARPAATTAARRSTNSANTLFRRRRSPVANRSITRPVNVAFANDASSHGPFVGQSVRLQALLHVVAPHADLVGAHVAGEAGDLRVQRGGLVVQPDGGEVGGRLVDPLPPLAVDVDHASGAGSWPASRPAPRSAGRWPAAWRWRAAPPSSRSGARGG